jgi:hypothetical protein
MSRLTDRGFSQVDADAFQARASGSHTALWLADVVRWVGGVETLLYDNLPIVGGTLSIDGSDPTRRKLTLEIAGGEELIPDDVDDPTAPFGQTIKLFMRIDRADGTWFPRLKMGEYPIQTVTCEWPGMQQTIEAADYSWVIDAFLFEKKTAFGKMNVRGAIREITEHALPESAFIIHSPDSTANTKVEPHTVAEAGSGRWEMVQSIAAGRGYEAFFDWNGNLVVRKDITNDDDDVETIPGEGPDVGTVSNPAAVIKDGPGGNLVALTTAVTREGAINGVVINLHETISQTLVARKKREAETGTNEDDPDDTTEDGEKVDPDDTEDDPELVKIPNPKAGDPRVNVQIAARATGKIKWSNQFKQNIVLERNVKRINNSVVNSQKKRAKRLLHRRGGVIRSVDADVVGCYWLEPDDKIRLIYAGRQEAHFVASVEIPLDGSSPTRIRCRSLTVNDPG